jgi:ABC-type bacteriocin/lantibiotic exporter with double-glycine peptidase domain
VERPSHARILKAERLIGLAALLIACSTRNAGPTRLDPPGEAALPSAQPSTAAPASAAEIPVVLQTEESDCGPAALAMTLSYYGHRTSLASMKTAMQFRSNGSSALDIALVATAYGLGVVGVGGEADVILPVLERGDILHVDANHFVVVDRVSPSAIEILDPARGRLTLDHAGFVERYSQAALLFASSPEALAARKRAISLAPAP